MIGVGVSPVWDGVSFQLGCPSRLSQEHMWFIRYGSSEKVGIGHLVHLGTDLVYLAGKYSQGVGPAAGGGAKRRFLFLAYQRLQHFFINSLRERLRYLPLMARRSAMNPIPMAIMSNINFISCRSLWENTTGAGAGGATSCEG